MPDTGEAKNSSAVTLQLGDTEGKIEMLPSQEGSPARVRLSAWSQQHLQVRPLDATEEELAALLRQAIRAGILSPDFVSSLKDEFEI